MGVYSINKQRVLNEAYFGNTKEIKALFDQFCTFRHRWIGRSRFFSEINYDHEGLKFNRMCEDFWGYGVFTFTIIANGEFNAYTYNLGSRLDINPRKYLRRSPHGPMYDKKANIAAMVFMYSGIFTSLEINDRECFAIFLHEIGHTFQETVIDSGGLFQLWNKFWNLASIIWVPIHFLRGEWATVANKTNATAILYAKINEDMKARRDTLMEINTISKSILNGYIYTAMTVVQIASLLLTPLNPLANMLVAIEDTLISKLTMILNDPAMVVDIIGGYEREKTADTFAAAYGFGPELASGLAKMNDLDGGYRAVHKVKTALPLFNIINEIVAFPVMFIFMIFDPHPNNAQRYRQCKKYLEEEIERQGIDPKMKDELKKQLHQMDDLEDELFDGGENQTHIVNQTYQKWLYENCKGDFRELLAFKSIPNQMDKAYKNASPVGKVKLF